MQVEELVLEVTCQIRSIRRGAALSGGCEVHVDRQAPLMQHIVQGVAEAAQGLLLRELLGELDGIKGVIQGINCEWVQIVVLVFCVVKELSHLLLVALHAEAVAPKDNQAGPGPHQT